MSRYQSRHDGEYRCCPRCEKLGYGPDAWHPCTGEYWPMWLGRLSYARCKACASEVSRKCYGVFA